MRRLPLLVAALCFACSSDSGSERSKAPPVSVSSGTGGGSGDTATPTSGAGGTTTPWTDPAAGGVGGAGVGGGEGGIAGTPAGIGGAGVPGMPVEGRTFDAGADPARNMVQPGGICLRLAQIQCAGETYCCEVPGRDRVACEEAQRVACADEGLIDVVAADSDAGFDAAHAASAFTQLEQLASACDATVASWGASTTGFIGIFKGSRSPGADCSPPGLIPRKADAAVALASCNTIDTSACLPDSPDPLDPWTCAPKGGAGAACLTDLNCQAGLYCPNPELQSGGFGLGTCAGRLPVAAPCGAGNECASLYCVGGACAPAETQAAYCLMRQL